MSFTSQFRDRRRIILRAGALLAVGCLFLPGTQAGFTDSTFGRAQLSTSSGLAVGPSDYDQSAASALFISTRGDLYISGARNNGDGNGGTPPPTADPTRVSFPNDTAIVDAAGSTNDFSTAFSNTNSYMALDHRGGVWTWGSVYPSASGHRLLGRGSIEVAQARHVGQVTTTAQGTKLPAIKDIARTENQFLALDGEGTLWAWGYGAENLPNPNGPSSAPLPLKANRTTWAPHRGSCLGDSENNMGSVRWHSLWGGNNSAGAVSQNGLIYSWGYDTNEPPAAGNGIVNATCPALNERANRALFLERPDLYRTSEGETYDERDLATENDRHARYVAIVRDMIKQPLSQCRGVKPTGTVDNSKCPVRQLGFPARASLLLLQSGTLLTWKSTALDYGDPFLGRTPSDSPYWPHAVRSGGHQVMFSSFTTGISSVQGLTREGDVLGWGWNNYCQAIGRPTSKADCSSPRDSPRAAADLVLSPTSVAGIPKDEKVVQLSATQCAAWATSASGTLYAWGAGTVAGTDFRTCAQPARPQAGYKIYDYLRVDSEHPFGHPVTDRATSTRKVAGP
ncbi:hypothetical protein GCM10027417_22390 [Glutamicibacter endophyticus]